MAVEVAKVELKSVQDASGLEERIQAGQFTADQVIAVIGKTEGNGGVNDFTRLLADHAFRRVLLKHGKRSEAEVATIPMVWSGGCDGIITPHATIFARNDSKGPLFATDERVEIVSDEIAHLENGDAERIEVRAFDSLLVGFAQSVGAKVVIRGLRAVSDFEYEFQMAGMNARLNPEIETVFLMASDRFQFISSRFVKEIGALGGDISHFVSPRVAARLLDRFAASRVKPRRRAAAAD